ncbi:MULTISPECIES: deoxynucleoside kinase [unclassified Mycoplasma]|uniref:deoxynucleoside kinase n=1 Tax=unclassified Mycoplasma TaxID=2683645 RepID=UPI000FDE7155
MKLANFIVIGGPIAAGKTTLTESLPFDFVSEIDEDDPILKILLEASYSKKNVHPEVIEFYFLKLRKMKYENHARSRKMHVLDRSILEAPIFARNTLPKASFAYWYDLWCAEVQELVRKFGVPKLYILLTLNFRTFEKRVLSRGRSAELKHFQSNQGFFRKVLDQYDEFMQDIFLKLKINYHRINTNQKSLEEVRKEALELVEKWT